MPDLHLGDYEKWLFGRLGYFAGAMSRTLITGWINEEDWQLTFPVPEAEANFKALRFCLIRDLICLESCASWFHHSFRCLSQEIDSILQNEEAQLEFVFLCCAEKGIGFCKYGLLRLVDSKDKALWSGLVCYLGQEHGWWASSMHVARAWTARLRLSRTVMWTHRHRLSRAWASGFTRFGHLEPFLRNRRLKPSESPAQNVKSAPNWCSWLCPDTQKLVSFCWSWGLEWQWQIDLLNQDPPSRSHLYIANWTLRVLGGHCRRTILAVSPTTARGHVWPGYHPCGSWARDN